MKIEKIVLFIISIIACLSAYSGKFAELDSPDTDEGYLAYLLINENPFPGEKSYVSVEDSKKGMSQILWVVNNRINAIPPGYTQFQVANTKAQNAIGIITAEGQCEGFFLGSNGKPSMDKRVSDRIAYLLKIANSGNNPGKFSELLNYAKYLSRGYVSYMKLSSADAFANLFIINKIYVTGRAYSWMTDKDYYNPGGSYIRIPDSLDGSIGGNRFFTLKKRK